MKNNNYGALKSEITTPANTKLHEAVLAKDPKAVSTLLQTTNNINETNKDNKTALELAIGLGLLEITTKILNIIGIVDVGNTKKITSEKVKSLYHSKLLEQSCTFENDDRKADRLKIVVKLYDKFFSNINVSDKQEGFINLLKKSLPELPKPETNLNLKELANHYLKSLPEPVVIKATSKTVAKLPSCCVIS